MKLRLAIFLIMIPTSSFSQGLTPYGSWGGPPEGQNRPYYPMPMPNIFDPFFEAPIPPLFETPPPDFKQNQFSANVRVPITPVAPDIVPYSNTETQGTIIIETKEKILFLTIDADTAYEYPIGVGREGFEWSGTEVVSRIQEWPDWNPPKEMLNRKPNLPDHMEGGIKNPLGAVAIYLGNSLYRIHGTNDPNSIGKAESSGCIRMLNEHAVHLASQVNIGTVVKVYR